MNKKTKTLCFSWQNVSINIPLTTQEEAILDISEISLKSAKLFMITEELGGSIVSVIVCKEQKVLGAHYMEIHMKLTELSSLMCTSPELAF